MHDYTIDRNHSNRWRRMFLDLCSLSSAAGRVRQSWPELSLLSLGPSPKMTRIAVGSLGSPVRTATEATRTGKKEVAKEVAKVACSEVDFLEGLVVG